MGQINVNLATLIGSRICHDLISPIGAINNGIELLSMAPGSTGPEMELISESVGNASARIRFFRIAYGAAGDQPIGRSEVVKVLSDYCGSGRVTVAYGPLEAKPRNMLRLVFLAIQCLETGLPYGGRIEIACTSERWTLTGFAEKTSFDPAIWDSIKTGETEGIAPAQVQFPLLSVHAGDLKRSVKCDHAEGSAIKIMF